MPQEGPPAQLLGMSCPQGRVLGFTAGQLGGHTQRRIAVSQMSPVAHITPTPGQVWPGHELVTGAPQAMPLGSAQRGTHSHMRVVLLQRVPPPQRVPAPHAGPPGQRFGIATPQSTPPRRWWCPLW